MRNERLVGAPFQDPADVVRGLCAVQSQDYAGAKWALAQRTASATSADIDRLFDEGRILRTHVLRPTWHFVAPADIRWMLALTAPRVHAANAHYYRKVELDERLFRRSAVALIRALKGGLHLTRDELAQVLAKAGIPASGMRLAYLMMHAELDGILCSGPRRGKQFTYALLEERVPRAKALDREEALAELTRRYFESHGPALVVDFAWWSGLTATQVRAGIELAKKHLVQETVDGKAYWFVASRKAAAPKKPTLHLLPNYDEYLIAYKDHAASFDASVLKNLPPSADALQAHILVLDGLVIGGWRRTVGRDEVTLTTTLLVGLRGAERGALDAAAERYGRFLEMPVRIL